MATAKRKWDLVSVATLAVVLAATLYGVQHVDPERVKSWLDELPTIVLAVCALILATRGKVAEAIATLGTVDSSRSRTERRERSTMPPPGAGAAGLALLVASCIPSGCTAAQGMAVLSAAEWAAKLGCEHLCPMVTGESGGESP